MICIFRLLLFVLFIIILTLKPFGLSAQNLDIIASDLKLSEKINHVLENQSIVRKVNVTVKANDLILDSLLSMPSLYAKLANVWSDTKYKVKDHGSSFYIESNKGNHATVNKVREDFDKNDLLYYADGVLKGFYLKVHIKMVMSLSYKLMDNGMVSVHPEAFIMIENIFFRKIADAMLNTPIIKTYLNKLIDYQVENGKHYGVMVINKLSNKSAYADFLRVSKLRGEITQDEYKLLDKLFYR